MQMREKLVEALRHYHMTIGSVESFTAGLFIADLASVPGASAVLRGGLVTYATDLKEKIAGVAHDIITQYGVVSPECAIAMARSGQQVLKTDICVSFTGNAGPTSLEGKPAGLYYIGIAWLNMPVQVLKFQVGAPRNALRQDAVEKAEKRLLELIENNFRPQA